MDISREALNALVSSKSNDLLSIHTMTPHRFALAPGQYEYTVGPALDDAGNATNADWVTKRPVRIEKTVLMLYTDVLDFTADVTSGDAPLTVTFGVTP